MHYSPHASIILTPDEAIMLARPLIAIQPQFERQGASLRKDTLRLAKDILSAAGKTENAAHPTDKDVEYEHITVAQAAEILDCSPRNITYLINHNKLTGQKRGQNWFLDREEVESFKAHRDNRSAHK
ncbi:helix-turn-helix domain-containing protein [Corynebacterium mastitidis]|uniref:Helix-turn-helix domain-containing protein n=1 Tax=Corynebacterium mastitidis TaxID=161890 RepID=A0A2N0X9H3_9CORY|nr:helix-turn-helix domain-containing protein [Corynebacterium mastitidis]PKF69344.1 hypothetical protein CXB45_02385 [Corynebacterium mastitidis]